MLLFSQLGILIFVVIFITLNFTYIQAKADHFQNLQHLLETDAKTTDNQLKQALKIFRNLKIDIQNQTIQTCKILEDKYNKCMNVLDKNQCQNMPQWIQFKDKLQENFKELQQFYLKLVQKEQQLMYISNETAFQLNKTLEQNQINMRKNIINKQAAQRVMSIMKDFYYLNDSLSNNSSLYSNQTELNINFPNNSKTNIPIPNKINRSHIINFLAISKHQADFNQNMWNKLSQIVDANEKKIQNTFINKNNLVILLQNKSQTLEQPTDIYSFRDFQRKKAKSMVRILKKLLLKISHAQEKLDQNQKKSTGKLNTKIKSLSKQLKRISSVMYKLNKMMEKIEKSIKITSKKLLKCEETPNNSKYCLIEALDMEKNNQEAQLMIHKIEYIIQELKQINNDSTEDKSYQVQKCSFSYKLMHVENLTEEQQRIFNQINKILQKIRGFNLNSII